MSKNRGSENRFSKTQKKKALKRVGGRCQNCGGLGSGDSGHNPLEPHHIIPVSQGGETTLDNCMIVCRNCHVVIHEDMKI